MKPSAILNYYTDVNPTEFKWCVCLLLFSQQADPKTKKLLENLNMQLLLAAAAKQAAREVNHSGGTPTNDEKVDAAVPANHSLKG